jgi:hypothetical protein
MFDIMVFIVISAFYVSLVLWAVIFVLRTVLAFTSNIDLKEKLFIVFLPCNYGVFLYIQHKKWLTVFKILIIILFITSFFASLFLFYNELGL